MEYFEKLRNLIELTLNSGLRRVFSCIYRGGKALLPHHCCVAVIFYQITVYYIALYVYFTYC